MTFDVCDDCGGASDWAGAIRFALMWALPTILFVLRSQWSRSSPLREIVSLVFPWVSAGAAVYSLFALGVLSLDDPVQLAMMTLITKAAILSTLLIAGYRRFRGRGAIPLWL